jgi:hypothetical protein
MAETAPRSTKNDSMRRPQKGRAARGALLLLASLIMPGACASTFAGDT